MSSITYNDIRQNRSNCFLKPTTLSYKKRAGETGLSWGTLLLVERQGGEAAVEDGIGAWLSFYNEERQHQSLGYHTPRQIYDEGLWICGRSALPTVCASPASQASSETGEMLAFAHIPTGTTANRRIDQRGFEGKVTSALTVIGADIEIRGDTP